MGGHCTKGCFLGVWPQTLQQASESRNEGSSESSGGKAIVEAEEAPLVGLKAAGPLQSTNSQALSKNQQKKQVHREARQAKKDDKKKQKQADALNAALATLSRSVGEDTALPLSDEERRQTLPKRLCAAFGTPACRYHELPKANGPSPTEGLAILGSSLLRPEKYGAKFLPQEYSLLHKIWSLLGGDLRGAGVLDIGAGNANCAVLAGSLLGLTVVCVERESPRVELRAEEQLPPSLRKRVIRVESDIADFDTRALTDVAKAYGLNRFVLVAKHPCGIGVDRSIDCAAQLRASPVDSSGPVLVGAVLATCCTNKLSFDDLRVSRVEEFCSLNASEFPPASPGAGTALVQAVEVMSRCSAWRSASGSLGNAICDEQLAWAELFEDHLQTLRLSRLRRAFGASREVRFAPRDCTLQDRCLLAAEPPFPQGLEANGEASQDEAFLAQLKKGVMELLALMGGPIDCRPRGLKSAKYDFDYTDDME